MSTTQAIFERDGFAVVPNLVPESILLDWRRFAHDHCQSTFENLFRHGHIDYPSLSPQRKYHWKSGTSCVSSCAMGLGLGVKNGFREIVMRSPGRYELSLMHGSVDVHISDKNNSNNNNRPSLKTIIDKVFLLLPNLLGGVSWDNCRLINCSFVISTPGAPEQSWHVDGGHIDLRHHLPCHCLNVFLPLQDISEKLGPTEFRPGSHYFTRNLAPMMLAAKARKEIRCPVTPLPRMGDAVIFDYRVLHRGKANQSDILSRTYLVITMAQPHFQDRVNFPSRSLFHNSSDDDDDVGGITDL